MSDSKEHLLATALDHEQATKLRSELVRNVDNVWVLVKPDRSNEKFDVCIANEWCGPPTDRQVELSQDIMQRTLAFTQFDPSMLKDDCYDVADDDITIVS